MNRKTLTTLIEIAGVVALVVGAFDINRSIGLIAVGVIGILFAEANA
jgi:hypothetical protein